MSKKFSSSLLELGETTLLVLSRWLGSALRGVTGVLEGVVDGVLDLDVFLLSPPSLFGLPVSPLTLESDTGDYNSKTNSQYDEI